MNLRLKQLRKAANMTQQELAKTLSVDIKTVGNWERGETIPNAEQLWDCAVALNCSPSDLLGWYETHPREPVPEDAFERELIGCYRESTTPRKGRILDTARDAAGMSKEPAKPAASEPTRREAV